MKIVKESTNNKTFCLSCSSDKAPDQPDISCSGAMKDWM